MIIIIIILCLRLNYYILSDFETTGQLLNQSSRPLLAIVVHLVSRFVAH